MKTRTEYWKKRCLLAESMLEDKFINNQDVTVSPFERFNWLYIEFSNLLNENNLKYSNHMENDCFIVSILDAEGKNIISVGSVSHEGAYENAIKAIKAHKQKIKTL